jgi:hypothetical protein
MAWHKVNLTGNFFVLFRLHSNIQPNTLRIITVQLRIIMCNPTYGLTEGTEFEPREGNVKMDSDALLENVHPQGEDVDTDIYKT